MEDTWLQNVAESVEQLWSSERVMERFAFSANILRIPDHIEEGRVAGTASGVTRSTVYYSVLQLSKPLILQLSKPLPNWAVVRQAACCVCATT